MTPIFIPTMGRVNEQETYDRLQPSKAEMILVCPPDEVAGHKAKGRTAIPCPAKGITATRQWIMDQKFGPRVFMFDDDLRFGVRRLDDPTKFYQATEARDQQTLLRRLDALLDQVPVAGLCSRGGANNTPSSGIPVAENKRLFDVHCIDVEWFHRENIQYRMPFMEDFDMCLQAHLKGYPTAMLTTHTKDNVNLANAGGGCSLYRTMEGQAEAAHILAARFPAFVSTRQVKAKVFGEWSTRTDVTVRWVQAFKAGCELRDIIGIDQYPARDWSDLAPEWGLI